jgi:hypothetical protein
MEDICAELVSVRASGAALPLRFSKKQTVFGSTDECDIKLRGVAKQHMSLSVDENRQVLFVCLFCFYYLISFSNLATWLIYGNVIRFGWMCYMPPMKSLKQRLMAR